MVRIGAVIVTYNIGKQLIQTVDSITSQVDELVIVDNHSTEETQLVLDDLAAAGKISLIRNDDNLGIARALNQGMNWLRDKQVDWILTLDHDSMASPDMIDKLLAVYDELGDDIRPSVAVLAPEIYDQNLGVKTRFVKSGDYARVNNVIQSGALYRLDKWVELGPFDESLFIYFVDDEFNKRVKMNGLSIYMVKSAVLFHEEGKRINKNILGWTMVYDQNSGLAKYYIVRNSIYMFRKFKEKRYIDRILVELVKVLLVEPKKLGYVCKGIYHGLSNRLGKYTPNRK